MRLITDYSVYELDTGARKIRRLTGLAEPTPNQGDGSWKQYEGISEPAVGQRLLIVWGITPPRPSENTAGPVLRTTQTSVVREIQP